MKFKVISTVVLAVLAGSVGSSAQTDTKQTLVIKAPTPKPVPQISTTPKLSETISKNVENLTPSEEVSRERREQAYAKLLEGQRYVWAMSRQRSQGISSNARLAKQAFQKAVELDPNLAEGYTALAELALTVPPNDINEAILLASLATKIDKDNFGAHRILSRLYTIKSGFNQETLDDATAQKAINEWKELTRLDSRNAEAWAFLSEFYKKTNKSEERIKALQNWIGSSAPVETRFYRTVMGNQENLSPEAATVKLGEALFDAGKIQESVEILNQSVADDPENPATVELLSKALEKADSQTAATSIQTLQQAIYTNPENTSLTMLLAKIQTRAGNTDDAAKFLNQSITKLAEKDKNAAANLQISLGDIYNNAERTDEAVAAYQKSLTIAGIDQNNLPTDEMREFAVAVYDKIIRAYKSANRPADAKLTIENSRKILGSEDSFTDRQLISFYRENGKKPEALQAVRAARLRFPDDYGFLRQEASILTDSGKVDEAVTIVKSLIGKKNTTAPTAMYDDFTNYLFISMLYSDAKRGKESIDAANQALQTANSEERRQIAKLTLATAQQNAGDFKSAETTLRGILAGSPNNPIALNNLGYFLVERNEKLDEALKLIQQAVTTEPDNSSYLDSLGWAYYKLGKFDLAEENLKKALKSDPSAATIIEHLGDVYQKQGKAELAKTMWQKALIVSSDNEQINGIKLKLNKKMTK